MSLKFGPKRPVLVDLIWASPFRGCLSVLLYLFDTFIAANTGLRLRRTHQENWFFGDIWMRIGAKISRTPVLDQCPTKTLIGLTGLVDQKQDYWVPLDIHLQRLTPPKTLTSWECLYWAIQNLPWRPFWRLSGFHCKFIHIVIYFFGEGLGDPGWNCAVCVWSAQKNLSSLSNSEKKSAHDYDQSGQGGGSVVWLSKMLAVSQKTSQILARVFFSRHRSINPLLSL